MNNQRLQDLIDKAKMFGLSEETIAFVSALLEVAYLRGRAESE